MALFDVSLKPTTRQLRQFGFIGLVALPLIGWFLLGWTSPVDWSASDQGYLAIWGLAGLVLGTLALLWPKGLAPVFIGATLITLPIGLVVGEVFLAAVFFLIFTPLAALFRLFGRDPLRRRFEPESASYWIPRRQRDVLDYYRQS